MKKMAIVAVIALIHACGNDDGKPLNNGKVSNNGTTSPNSGTASNNGTTSSNNGTLSNNATSPNNNGTTNDGTTGTTTSATTSEDLCLDVVCENPNPSCSGTIATTFEESPTCNPNTGECETIPLAVDCVATSQACNEGVCVETCQLDDPCLPPDDVCNGTVLTSYSGQGMCDAAIRECSYDTVKLVTDCDANQQICQDDSCVDLCATETCTLPAFCTGDIATSYSAPGLCNYLDGTCDYTNVEVVSDCTLNNKICSAGACIFPPAIPPTAGDLVISEILPFARSGNPNGDWFEITNITNTPIILNNLILKDDDTDSHVVQSAHDLIVNPGQYFVFGTTSNMLDNGGFMVDYAWENSLEFELSPLDEIIIETSSGVIIDEVAFSTSFGHDWRYSSQLGNQHDFMTVDNNDEQFWCQASQMYGVPNVGVGNFGTPGAANDACVIFIPPVLTIYEIQDATNPKSPAIRDIIDIRGVVVTGLNEGNFWVQEVAGGPYSGLLISSHPNFIPTNLKVGDTVNIVGEFFEFTANAQLAPHAITVVSTVGIFPTPKVLSTDVFSDPIEAEKWEGVLIQINEAAVTETKPERNFIESAIDNQVRIDHRLFDYTPPTECTFYERIVGVVDNTYYRFRIQPRNLADMIVSTTPVSMSTTINIQGSGYSPKVTCITHASQLTFTNLDVQSHDAVGRNPAEGDPNNITALQWVPLLAPNASHSLMGLSAGTQHYRSTQHPHMEGVVIILP